MDQDDKRAVAGQRHSEADAIGLDGLQVRSHAAAPDWMDPHHN